MMMMVNDGLCDDNDGVNRGWDVRDNGATV